ncbi:MAG: LLM class flavin-dependent oxidoreductase [Chloroflexota bacterium]
MKFGVSIPNFEHFCDAAVLADMAQEAETAGWDGFFIWDHILFDDLWHPMVDPWVALTAIAMKTEQIKIGPLVTPLPRRRPWKLAREMVSVDRLSNGRLIMGVGLGAPARWEYGFFGETVDQKVQAEMLDEGLQILVGLCSGEPFSFQGNHYQLEEMRFLPTPVQKKIPIWVAGGWPNRRPFRRAARWDGVVPQKHDGPLTPDAWREILAYIHQHRTSSEPFEAIGGGIIPANDPEQAAEIIQPFADAGVTWWLESASPYDFGLEWDQPWTPDIVERGYERIRQGPPRISVS